MNGGRRLIAFETGKAFQDGGLGQVNRFKQLQILFLCKAIVEKLGAKKLDRNLSLDPILLSDADALEKDTDLLEQAWSEMAIRNLLSSISRILSRIDPKLPAELSEEKKMCAGARKQIDALLKTNSPTKARYHNVICIGYKFRTGDSRYSGLVDDRQDMLNKCADLKDAIRVGYNAIGEPLKSDGTMLKVFMAPEFFFRGSNGAYEHDVVNGKHLEKGILDIMGEEIDKPIYKDWLFVLGTAIAATKITETKCAVCGGDVEFVVTGNTGKSDAVCKRDKSHKGSRETPGRAMVDNVAFVKKEADTYIVSKELVSDIDYIMDEGANLKNLVNVKGERLDVIRVPKKSGYHAGSSHRPKFQDERMGGSVFTVDGVTFGLEVCLDHAATTASADVGRLQNASNIQMQLVPSAGMSITHLRTVENGIVFNVDGAVPHVQVVKQGRPDDFAHFDFDRLWGKDVRLRYDQTSGKFKFAKPRIAPAGRGSILVYGPFQIPMV